MTETAIRTVIVDDEEPARELLRAFLAAWPQITIVGEAGDGQSAIDLILEKKPALAFLDVQMPGVNGLDVVGALPAREMPLIVFVTAYDEYAVKAFEVSACDYLLKPFDQDRLAAALERVFARRGQPSAEVLATLRDLAARVRPSGDAQVVVKADGRHVFLRASEIEWIEAKGKESRIHVAASTVVTREPMNSFEARLDPTQFVRVHRSAIVNRSHIREIQPWFKGSSVLVMRRGTRIVSGRSYRAELQRLTEARG